MQRNQRSKEAKKMSFNEPSLRSAVDLEIRQVRGKYVISSMPNEWIFGKANTFLECQKCMTNATWRGVLIGACEECLGFYDAETLLGFSEKPTEDAMPGRSTSAPFGFYRATSHLVCQKIDELMDVDSSLANIPSKSKAINHEEAYSLYGLASFKKNSENISLLLDSPYGLKTLSQRYKCAREEVFIGEYLKTDPRWYSITCLLGTLSDEFNPHSKTFYKKCEKMEKEWIQCEFATTQEQVDVEMGQQKEKEKEKEKKNETLYECHYCGIKGTKKEVLRCGSCKGVRYCSVACQSRDWTKGGAYMCDNGVPSDPHKACCPYLTTLRLDQEKYDQMIQEARDDRDDLERVMEDVD